MKDPKKEKQLLQQILQAYINNESQEAKQILFDQLGREVSEEQTRAELNSMSWPK